MSDPAQAETVVLVIDDEPSILQLLRATLAHAGHEVLCASDGITGVELAAAHRPDLVILDVLMPGPDGLEVCGQLRELSPDLPIMFLSARHSEEDRVAGLRRGGDDYLTKPFHVEELTLRVAALLRRSRPNDSVQRQRVGAFVLDGRTHRAEIGDVHAKLSPTEFRLLSELLRVPGQVVTKEELVDRVWAGQNATSNTVETYISYLRRKLGTTHASRIQTVRGVGYRAIADEPL